MPRYIKTTLSLTSAGSQRTILWCNVICSNLVTTRTSETLRSSGRGLDVKLRISKEISQTVIRETEVDRRIRTVLVDIREGTSDYALDPATEPTDIS